MPSHPSNVLVSGAGSTFCDGIYVQSGESVGKPQYVKSGGGAIYWDSSSWLIDGNGEDADYDSNEDVANPWLAISWNITNGEGPAPTVTEVLVSNTLGLSGVKYEGYFDGDPQWFTTATRTSATELRSNFNPVSPTPENGYSWEWTGYFKPLPGPAGEIEDDFTFTMGSDDIGIMWVGNAALSGYTTANRTVSAYGYEQSEPISLRADTYYPVRIQFGHPIPPTAVSLQIQANPTLRMANDFVFGNLFNVPGGDGGISEFQRVANLHGGVANFLRKRLLGQF